MDNPLYEQIVKKLTTLPAVASVALGGSRSIGQAKPDSDYDLFVIVNDNQADSFFSDFADLMSQLSKDLIFFGKDKYLEEWGYMYCGLDIHGCFYDIAVIPFSRINEMCIRSTNIILFDTNNVFKEAQAVARDIDYKAPTYLAGKIDEVIRMIYLNYYRFLRNLTKADYWMAVRFLNILRENVLKLYRIKTNTPSKLFFLPDENFESDTGRNLRNSFILDGSFESLKSSANILVNLVLSMHEDSDVFISQINQISKIDYEK